MDVRRTLRSSPTMYLWRAIVIRTTSVTSSTVDRFGM